MEMRLPMALDEKMIRFLASGGYSGLAPFMPGTLGTLAGLPLACLFSFAPFSIGFLLILSFILFAIFIAEQAEKIDGKKDPGWIVVDEIAGVLVTMAAIPFSFKNALLGFLIFRGFDILKPFPVGYLDRNFSGGPGIVLDDVAAGLMANLVLQIYTTVI